MNQDATERFFQRWARRKAQSQAAPAPAASLAPVDGVAARRHAQPSTADAQVDTILPTLADVGLLRPDADFSPYLAARLDRGVHRAAMKKLFSDPHFNAIDGLDIYMDDYTRPSPVSAAMLGMLAHARATLAPQPAWGGNAQAPLQPAEAVPDAAHHRLPAAGRSGTADQAGDARDANEADAAAVAHRSGDAGKVSAAPPGTGNQSGRAVLPAADDAGVMPAAGMADPDRARPGGDATGVTAASTPGTAGTGGTTHGH